MNLYPITGLFFYRPIFMAWLLFGESFFLLHKKHRPHFVLRLLLSLFVCIGLSFAYPIPTDNAFYLMGMFFVFFLLSYGAIFFCFDANWKSLLFAALCGYTTEHISNSIYQMIFSFISASLNLQLGGLYSNEGLSLFSSPMEAGIYFASYVLVYWIIFVTCGLKMKDDGGEVLKRPVVLVLGAAFLGFDIVFSSVVSFYSSVHYDGNYIGFLYLLNAACCSIMLVLMYELFYRGSIQRNLEVANELRREEKAQYELSKETIDLINIKCHDLKYQIRQVGNQNALPPEAVENMAKVISIYDSAIKTGNEALDVVLTQKSLFLNQNQVKFNCIADGSAISFLSEADTYSLFGNMIDNAYEAVKDLEEKKRIINLRIRRKGNLVSVSEENCYAGEIVFKNGLPVTRKTDPRYHGFGLRSIQMVCEKYQGDLSIEAKDNRFHISVLFFLGKTADSSTSSGK